MAIVDLATLTAPVSEEDPCGPDLELAGDSDYMNFVARAEGLLPASFFQAEKPKITLADEFAEAKPVLAKTRDVRLLTLLAKLAILSRDADTFVVCLGGLHALLGERWDEVHPRGEGGDFGIRMAALETLDDLTPIVLPLQYLPLATHRRYGPISQRSYMIATGEVKAREGEETLDLGTLEKSMMEVDLPALIESRSRFAALRAAVVGIQKACLEHVGAGAVALQRLPALIDKTATLLEGVIRNRDPSLAVAAEGSAGDNSQADGDGAAAAPGSTIPSGAVLSSADVAEALAAIVEYFGRHEPSNPALLLVRQAQQLMGKSFLDAMRVLVPTHVDKAVITIGRDQVFDLPVEKLSAFAAIPDGLQSVSSPPADGAALPKLSARTRADAVRLLDQIAAYYRVAEPSSPVPFLTDRARSMTERDFLSLLKDILPKAALKSIGA
jgi:type VI secretion system protein ImpA